MVEELLAFNTKFVKEKQYEQYATSKYPDKKIAILSCMDTRLTVLLPAALGLKNGDVKIIKNAGAPITQPFGSAVRSLLIAIYELGVEEILIIGHTDCGVQHMDSQSLIEKMKQKGIAQQTLDMMDYCGIDFASWLSGFEDVDTSVREAVELLRNHPLVPKDVAIYGFVMDTYTGAMRRIEA